MPLADGNHGPPPLRSEEFPMGFPWITGVLRDTLDSANAIYIFLAAFCFWLSTLDIGWSIENPGRSYLWNIEDCQMLIAAAYFVLFHSCIHGSERKKLTCIDTEGIRTLAGRALTALLTNGRAFESLAGYCQDDHDHLPWSHTNEDGEVVFDTSKEAAYPKLFCERFASILADGAGFPDSHLNQEFHSNSVNVDARVATNKQPRGRKLPPLLSEFDNVKTVRSLSADEPALSDKRTLTQPYHGIPVGSKLLRWAKAKRGQAGEDNAVFEFLEYTDLFRSLLNWQELLFIL